MNAITHPPVPHAARSNPCTPPPGASGSVDRVGRNETAAAARGESTTAAPAAPLHWLLGCVLTTCLGAQPHYFVHVPDTQYYSNTPSLYPHWVGMCWTIRSWAWPPAYVAHVGDYTEDATDTQFVRGNAAMSLLGSLPWGASIGNHDYDGRTKCTLAGGPCTLQWREHRGPENFVRVVGTPAGPVAFLHLEWRPSDAAIELARTFLDNGGGAIPTVLVTHEWLDAAGTHLSQVGSHLDAAGDNAPAELWAKLVDLYPSICMVLCGHAHGVARTRTRSHFGTDVLSFLFNTQFDTEGGQGFMRLYGFFGDELLVASLSATWQGLPPDRREFWSMRYPFAAHRASLARPTARRSPVADTFVRTHYGGGASFGSAEVLYAESANDQQVALLRFDLGGITSVDVATLTLTFEGHSASGAGVTLHRMLRPWQETDSWASLGGLVAGRDYEELPDFTVPAHGRGTLSLDVSASVRAQLQGVNHGWAIVGRGESSGFRSREWHASTERPLLSVRQ